MCSCMQPRRDVDGSKVHEGLREPYGESYKEGDVMGLLLHMPPGR